MATVPTFTTVLESDVSVLRAGSVTRAFLDLRKQRRILVETRKVLDLEPAKEIIEKSHLRWLIHVYRMKNKTKTRCGCFGRTKIEMSVVCCCQFEKHAEPCSFVLSVRMLFLWLSSVACCLTRRDMSEPVSEMASQLVIIIKQGVANFTVGVCLIFGSSNRYDYLK